MTLAEIKGRQLDTTLPRLQKSDYSILWADDFWDGVISGVLFHKDKEFWFDMIQENKTDDLEGGWYRRFAVVELSAEQMSHEREIHEGFRRFVGKPGAYHPKEQWHLFYDKHSEFCRTRSFGDRIVVAWFEE